MTILFLLFTIGLSFAGVTEPAIKWTKSQVTVCWGSSEHFRESTLSEEQERKQRMYKASEEDFLPFTNHQKQLIRNLITNEYTPVKTGIHYVGWEDCSSTLEKSDVILFRTERHDFPEGSASLANGIAEAQNNASYPVWIAKNYSTNKRFVMLKTYRDPVLSKVSDDESLSITAVHEFGHLSALRHEHADHEYSQKDPNCKRAGFWSRDALSSSSKKMSTYDPNSIMSSCFMLLQVRKETGLNFKAKDQYSKLYLTDPSLFKVEEENRKKLYTVKIGLSKKDVHALRCLYMFDSKKQTEICHKYYDD